jgi:hypothetical protein
MTFEDFIDEIYLSLLKQNYKLPQIDEMDLWYFLKLARKQDEIEERKAQEATIAQMDALGI